MEDKELRKCCEEKLGIFGGRNSVYYEAGVTKIVIHRKANQIELQIHAARPGVLLDESKAYGGKPATGVNLLLSMRTDLAMVVNYPRKVYPITQLLPNVKVRIKVFKVLKGYKESCLVARSVAWKLEQRVAFRKVLRQTSRMLEERGVRGFKVQVAGRLGGAEIARAERINGGRVPLQTLRADIGYSTCRAETRYGVIGVKVWIFNKEV
jgi:small subunit ribosomal protein S3